MTIKIELDKFHCKGCGACEEMAPDIFRMDETGEKADLIQEEVKDSSEVEQAAVMCPTQCIEISYNHQGEEGKKDA